MADARFACRTAFALLLLLAVFLPSTASAQGGRMAVPRLKDAEFAGPPERAAVRNAPAAEPQAPEPPQLNLPLPLNAEQMVSPKGMSSTLNLMILLTVLSLAPSILMMTTCFIRFIIVMGLLRQALGTQTLPPNQVIISLCLFLTFMAMAPVWQESYTHGIYPYTHPDEQAAPMGLDEAFQRTALPIRRFMGDQIDRAGNSDTVWLFVDAQRPDPDSPEGLVYRDPESYDEVPLLALLPAYMLSELKTAFIIGFQIYLPFVVIDMVIATVLTAMGMMMLPPVMISLPFKLLLFVLIDGWGLTVGMLLESVRPFG